MITGAGTFNIWATDKIAQIEGTQTETFIQNPDRVIGAERLEGKGSPVDMRPLIFT